jgi:hypothetical protein
MKKIFINKNQQIFNKSNNNYEQAFLCSNDQIVEILKEEENFLNINLFSSNNFYIKKEFSEKKIIKKKYKKISKENKKNIIDQSKNTICCTKQEYLKMKKIASSTYYYWRNNLDKEKKKEKKNIYFIHEIIIIWVYRLMATFQNYITKYDQIFLFFCISNRYYSTPKINQILNKNKLSFKNVYTNVTTSNTSLLTNH